LGDAQYVPHLLHAFFIWVDYGDDQRSIAKGLELLDEGRLAQALVKACLENSYAELTDLSATGDLRPLPYLLAGLENGHGEYERLIAPIAAGLVREHNRLLCLRHLARLRPTKLGWTVHSVQHHHRTGPILLCIECRENTRPILADQVVAVLDANMQDDHTLADAVLRGNWLRRGGVFDFDRVEIVNASDRDVERLCVQVGNDADSWRRPRYRKIECGVHPACVLSENTRRLLRSTFGSVVARPG
jgi:hypothetical protein